MASKKNSIILCISSPGGDSRQSLSEVESVIVGSGAGVGVKIADPQVSNFHVMLRVDASGVMKAIDLGSEHGTKLGDKAIHGPTQVNHGDVLTVGQSQVRVLFGDEPALRPVVIEPGANRATALPTPQVFTSPHAPKVHERSNGHNGHHKVPAGAFAQAKQTYAPVLPHAPVLPASPVVRANAVSHGSLGGGTIGTAPVAAPKPRPAGPAPMLFGELRPEVAPTEKDKVLQVAMLWGDQVLNVRQFPDGVPVKIGGAKNNPFQLESPVVGNAFTLAAANGVKRIVNIPTDADVVVRSNGRLQKTDGNALELGLNDRVQVSVDNLSFVLQYVKPAPQLPPGRRRKADLAFAAIALFVLLAGVAFIAGMALAPKPDYAALDGMTKADQRIVKMIIHQQQEKKRKQAAVAKLEEKQGAEEGKKAKDEEGEMGKPTEPQPKKAEASKSGTLLTDAQKKERDRQKVNNTGLLSVLSGNGGSISNVVGPGGHGGGINEALGGLTSGGVLGDQRGVGGLGARGTGRGGGGDGLTIGGLGTKGDGPGRGGSGFDIATKGKDTVRVIPGKVIIEGGLPKDVIAQIIRSHEKEIKYCYELELNKDPSLSGKVAALFIIDGSGAVSEANVSETTLNNASVERCMMQKIKRWRFPEPKGGGIVTVTYPWVFKPSAGEE